MKQRVRRQAIDLSAYPDLVVIYLGMRVNTLRGIKTVLGFGPRISKAVAGQPDGLLLHELEKGTPDAITDSDAEQTLNYLRAYTLGIAQVRNRGQHALDTTLITRDERLRRSGSPL